MTKLTYDNLATTWQRVRDRDAEKRAATTRPVVERHQAENAALNAKAKAAKDDWRKRTQREKNYHADRTGIPAPADMGRRHADEGKKIEEKFAAKRAALDAKHERELREARSAALKAARK